MKSTIYVALFIIAFCYLSKIQISFKPFKVHFNDLAYGFGWVFLLLAIILMQISAYNKGNIQGYSDALDDVLKTYKKELGKK